jgi:Cactus-binding C-terminus of cactin protein/Conserved mid region of cactin
MPEDSNIGDREHKRSRSVSSSSSRHGHKHSKSSKHSRRSSSRSRERHHHRHKHHKHSKHDDRKHRERSSEAPVPTSAPLAPPPALNPNQPSSSSNASKLSGKAVENKITQMFGYTSENNPFGDPNLLETFTWKKKIEKELATGVRTSIPTKGELRAERAELMGEIEQARLRRQLREKDAEEVERLKLEENRIRDASQYEDWEVKETQFHKVQMRVRTLLHIRERRLQPFDRLVANPFLVDAYLDEANPKYASVPLREEPLWNYVEIADPTQLVPSMPLDALLTAKSQLEELKEFEELELSPSKRSRGGSGVTLGRRVNLEYWTALLLLVQDAIAKAQLASRPADPNASSSAIKSSLPLLEEEFSILLSSKDLSELVAMERSVLEMLEIDARSKLPLSLESQLAEAEEEAQWYRVMQSNSSLKALPPFPSSRGGAPGRALLDAEYWEAVLGFVRTAVAKKGVSNAHQAITFERICQVADRSTIPLDLRASLKASSASLSLADSILAGLQLLRDNNVIPQVDVESDAKQTGEGASAVDAFLLSDVVAKDSHGLFLPTGLEEIDFGLEAEVPLARDWIKPTITSPEQIVPQKPKYFNRVKTGYNWNSYNKTHYDKENPPPKVVHGYKFNLFYPDLLDKTKTPSFRVEPTDSDEFCILRFSAGPPYEDVAFKIVNREWEYNKKHGFRCVFEKGVLQLFFNFKRQKYRR